MYAGRVLALPRVGRLAFAFFEIAVELLDQIQDRRRLTVLVWRRFPGLVFAIAPHNLHILSTFILLLDCEKGLIYAA